MAQLRNCVWTRVIVNDVYIWAATETRYSMCSLLGDLGLKEQEGMLYGSGGHAFSTYGVYSKVVGVISAWPDGSTSLQLAKLPIRSALRSKGSSGVWDDF